MPDGKKIKATSYEGLLEKLYDYYTTGLKDYSVESVFNAALHEKAVTENPKEYTLAKNSFSVMKMVTGSKKRCI